MNTSQIPPETKVIKDFSVLLKDMEPAVKNPQFLRNGRPTRNFKMLPREAWGNWLLCAVYRHLHGDTVTFAETENGDGILIDKISKICAPIEHVSVLQVPSKHPDLDYYDVSTVLKECREQYSDGALELVAARAEELAFSLAESHDARGDAHYFGPRSKGTRADGTTDCWPDVRSLTQTEIGYWATRADLTGNAFLRARYSDLVWDLSFDAAGERAPVTRAHAAIDASIEAVDRQMFKWPITAQNRLRRALDLSVSIRDDERAKRAVAAIMTLDDLLAQTAGRGFAFDTLTASRRVPVTEVQRSKLVEDPEAYLTALANSAVIIPVEVENVVERLLRHYRQAGIPRASTQRSPYVWPSPATRALRS